MHQFKDPVYGYVHVPKEISNRIIDSSVFQRLRSIRQTSYCSLYPSSLHNRFVHSIGVYYLGTLATTTINTPEGHFSNELEMLKKDFRLACLLHDIGHAPFSHTGEQFYFIPNGDLIIQELCCLVNDETFSADIRDEYKDNKRAAEHEIVSTIIALREFSDTVGDCAFFARCILGYKYRSQSPKEQIMNCYIQMLNSTLIDVDRLDYIIRDAHSTGFQSVSIDYERLLKGWTIIKDNDKFQLAYKKGAISVIENVLYAHDAEKKWIQNHPAIVYDNFLVEHLIKRASSYFCKGNKKLFSIESLTRDGVSIKGKGTVRLLSDDDVLFLAKNEMPWDELTEEYFERNKRKHPIWKSESEYAALIEQQLGDRPHNSFQGAMAAIVQYMINNDLYTVNDALIEHCKKEMAATEADDGLPAEEKKTFIDGRMRIIQWTEALKSYAEKHEIDFSFIIVTAKKFKSNFSKKDMESILVSFGESQTATPLRKLIAIPTSATERENFFYIYYIRNAKNEAIDAEKFAEYICREAMGK